VKGEADYAELLEDELDDVEQVAGEDRTADRDGQEEHLPKGERRLD
jgi:hypothetical protein